MPLSRLHLLPERDQPGDAVWLYGSDGSQTILISISRADLADLIKQRGWGPLAPSDENYLVSINLDHLLPVAEGRRVQGKVGQHTNHATGRITPFIELTMGDLEPGIKRAEKVPHEFSASLEPREILDTASTVFISYNGDDESIAERLAFALAQHGLASWSFGHVWTSGLPMPERIDEMIRFSRAVVVIHSDRELGANVAMEIDIARANKKPIIVLLTKNIDPSASLHFANTYVDAFTNWDAAINDLLRAIGTPRLPASVSSDPINKPRRRRPPKSVEQRPAAYRFTTAGDKVDVLPELPEPLDRELAADTQKELSEKAQNLLARLKGTNSAQRVCESVQRLLDALDVPFDQLRPGILLSRVRSLEADGAAFDTEDARAELFPDAFAQVADTVQTARDLLGAFPKVRQIEVERVALDLHRLPDSLPAIEQHAHDIEEAAQKSGVVTPDAARALAQNDAAINAAANLVLRGGLVGDKLLVIGNFARAVAETGWARGLGVGVGIALTAAPLMALAYSMAGPVGALAVIPAFRPLSRVFSNMLGNNAKEAPTKSASGADAISQRARNAAARNHRRKAEKPVLPKAALEALFLVEAKKTPQWAHLDVLHIKPGPTPGSWEVEGWGQLVSERPRDAVAEIQNVPILEEIAKRLNGQFALRTD